MPKTNQKKESSARSKQNQSIRDRYKQIKMKIIREQGGVPLSRSKSELIMPLINEINLFASTSTKKGAIPLSQEEIFIICLHSLNVELRRSHIIDQEKALALYKTLPGVDSNVKRVPAGEVLYLLGEDIINRHSVISTRIRAIILGYSERVSDDDGDNDVNHDSEASDNNNGNDDNDDNTSVIVISDSEEDQLDSSQSEDDEYDGYFVKQEEYLF